MNRRRLLAAVLRWVLALVFTVAAGLKVGGGGGSGGAETMVGSLPVWGQWLLVAVELGLAVWLAGGWLVRWAAFAMIVVLSIFMGAIVWEMGKPQPLSCGCFGQYSPPNLWFTLTGDALLLVLAVALYYVAWGTGRTPTVCR